MSSPRRIRSLFTLPNIPMTKGPSQTSFFQTTCRTYASSSQDATQNLPPAARTPPKKKIVVAMTGATGAILGIKLLKALRRLSVETHLVMSKWAEATIKYETDFQPLDIRSLADHCYGVREQSAPISSGSFRADGMIVVPCSMKTLASIRMGYSDDLISRAADVMLKERRKLVLAVRETPLSDIHLENMLSLTRSGAVIFPPVPAWYTRPRDIGEMEDQSVGRMLDMFQLDTGDFERWEGFKWKK
ncbi:3-polyprenyl-4-hydroxybenzoate decarboxylase [Mytilinidion resinicola]|uniref:Flavin prenyltransferase PAD1, mitochondrial n=1 Tax=Mytilinidion resinicola TaxID=574789 RepID=A0A6A6YX83_9PEZI|nr:3-polyprenyl-4-hydroxybenzoate decarboxylase [Mytilinidion resinicola]KAF2813168.1 3-polyprenyl-4-hydroxybenzoate decarboxylase [Mytilinidion resinicola]